MRTHLTFLPALFLFILEVVFAGSIQAQATSVKRITRGLPGSTAPAQAPSAKPVSAPVAAIVPAQASTNVTNLFFNGAPGKTEKEKDDLLRKTIEYQKKRAGEGSATSQYDLGMRYLKGDGLGKDLDLARKWLTLSADGGNNQAREKLSELGKK